MRRMLAFAVAISFLSFLAFGATACRPVATAPATGAAPASRPDAVDGDDGRQPLPLLPMMANHQKANMRDHLVAVNEIVRGVAADDYAAVEAASRRIGFSEAMGQQCSHMGAAADGFTERAIEFHKTADGITAAAQKKDRAGVLRELDATLTKCTTCHAMYRQQVVDEARWTALTGSASPHAMH